MQLYNDNLKKEESLSHNQKGVLGGKLRSNSRQRGRQRLEMLCY